MLSKQNQGDIDDTSFLIYPLDRIHIFLDHVIQNYPPQAYPLERRTLPANAIYLAMRFAVYRCGGNNTQGIVGNDEVGEEAREDGSGGARDDSWLNTILEQATMSVERVCTVSNMMI